MMKPAVIVPEDQPFTLANLPPSRPQKRLALAVVLATRGCHFDNYPSDEWAGKSEARTVYSDCMVEMDHVLGRLVDKLQQIGELENTLIILTSDNGPECEIPPHARMPFRGCKGSSWEGGVRVPTFAY